MTGFAKNKTGVTPNAPVRRLAVGLDSPDGPGDSLVNRRSPAALFWPYFIEWSPTLFPSLSRNKA
jgi:hypothetical protein